MGYEYKQLKNKMNRYAYRLIGILFAVIGVACGVIAVTWHSPIRFLFIAFALGGIAYGFFLIKASFRLQAYDMTYRFMDKEMIVLHKKGETKIPYDDVLDVKVFHPDPTMDYKIMQIKTTKQQFVLSFDRNMSDCDTLTAFINERVFTDEE